MFARNRTLLLPALLVFVALPSLWLGACGGDDDAPDQDEYAQEVQAALSELGTQLGEISDQIRSSDQSADLASGLDQARTDFEETATELENLDVPEALIEINDDLVAAIKSFASGLGDVVEQAESGGAQGQQQATADLVALVGQLQSDINAVRQEADEAGLTLGPASASTTGPAE